MSYSAYQPTRRSFLTMGAAALATGMLGGKFAFAQEAKKVQFQLSWIKSIQYGGYFAGIETGAFSKQSLDVTFNPGGPNMDPVANVASGQMMLGDRPSGPLIIAREKGIPVKIIATVFQKSPFSIISPAAKPIKTIKDLAGKTIAISTSVKPLILNLLQEAGISPDAVNMLPASPDPSALVSGQIDAYTGYVTNQGVMLQTKGFKIYALNAQDLGMPETAGTIYAREDFLAANHDTVVSFLKGAIAGWDWALKHPQQIAHLMVDKYGSPGLNYDAQLREIEASAPYITANKKGLLAIDPALYQQIIDLYRKAGLIKSTMTASDLCDTRFVDAALS